MWHVIIFVLFSRHPKKNGKPLKNYIKQAFFSFRFNIIYNSLHLSPKFGANIVTFADRNNLWQNISFTIRNNGL